MNSFTHDLMEAGELIGFVMAVVIGTIIGMVGGGGSTVMVPVLTYLVGLSAAVATGYSLFIVGIASLFGTYNHIKRRLVDFKIALLFGLPAVAGVFLVRKYGLPAIPEHIATFGEWEFTKGSMLMFLLAILIFGAAVSMITSKKSPDPNIRRPSVRLGWGAGIIFAQGAVIGALTGLVGTGGGFMIIPALVLICKLEMKVAVGTTLLIATAKSLVGFVGEMQVNTNIDWYFLLIFTGLVVSGVFIGNYLSKRLSNETLQRGFGWFILAVGLFIIIKEIVSV